jgi:pimeloyl-ACP methyl ester carboxylesterase
MKKIRIVVVALAVISFTGACALFVSSRGKLDARWLKTACVPGADTLIVFLPGLYDSPDDLIEHGFARALQEKRMNADIVIPNLHFGYYLARTAVQRLHEDVILPAREKGYRQIWLAGISLGGFGSLLYIPQHPEMANGLVLIAPYLGGDKIQEEIANAGGLGKWTPEISHAWDYERNLWSWLKTIGNRRRQGISESDMYLGYGSEDRFANINRLLAARLPGDHVITANGGHDWLPWLQIWKSFLDKKRLPACRHE